MQTEYAGPIQPIRQNVDGFVTFEQSNREHEQIIVQKRNARLRIMVNLTD